MSVPAWARGKSKSQYIFETYMLNIRIGQIVMSKPKKYRENYGDHVIRTALDALKFCQAANAIYMNEKTSEEDYRRRKSYLTNALAYIDHISTVADIFLGLNYNVDGAKQEQIDRQEEYIGSTCKTIHDLIRGVIDSDTRIFKGEKEVKTPSRPPNAVKRKQK